MLPQTDFTQIQVAPTLHWTEDFAAWLHEHERMSKTIMAYLQDMRHFAKFFEHVNGQAFAPNQLNATDVKAYFAAQDADKAVAPTSRNRRLATLRVLVEWSVAMGILEYDPTVAVKREKVELTPRDRTSEEMRRLNDVIQNARHIKCAGEGHAWLALRDSILWALFVDTGLRIHEIAALNVEDFDFQSAKLNVLGKGAKKAEINVPTSLMTMIASWLDLRPACAGQILLTGWSGDRMTTGQIRKRIKMIGVAAGIHDLKPHDLRHTYAYELKSAVMGQGLSEEKALDAVRKQLRHGDVKTTMLYFRVRESQIRAAVEAM